ncbi:MAG: hypothetical protein J6D34_08355 [Atopobiaceae bacterium]|nr:hypothetical protein [Atopobiaceae bacterium]
MSLTCELCGSTDFVKDQGVFVCRGCGCKYTLEEARDVMAQAAEAEAASQAHAAQPPQPPAMDSAVDFSPQIANGLQGAQAANNYICQGWRLLLDDYKRLEHPTKQQQDDLGRWAREVLVLLENAARLDPENHLQALLILGNCKTIADQAHQTEYYDKDSEGKWHRHSFALDVKTPGQAASWEDLIRFHKGFLRERYLNNHPDEVDERAALVAQRETLEAQLAELKDEKRSKGFFNFAEKREVKDRMKPYKEELSQVNRQISELDGKVEAYIKQRVAELASGYVKLS